MRFLKFVAAVLFIPFVFAATFTYGKFFIDFAVRSFNEYWSFWIGLFCYPIFQTFVYKPTRFYIIEHEVTHSVFAIFSGAKLKKFSVKKDNGSVVVDKTNTLITLAPYFFPFFAISFFLLWKSLLYFYPLFIKYSLIFYGISGALLSFHFFMTVSAVFHGQPDIKSEGVIFSLVFIFIVYIFLSVFFIKLLFGESPASIELKVFFGDLKDNTVVVYSRIYNFVKNEICPIILHKK